ncbi:hypothetical protein [Sphingomonas melonis]|uniref:hypothetical protein n=1 Tax=Sphingomonas melonis TaxID=152682 RepID=UPI000374D37A|nr:hypothetical protein [Sphingomonas melonis]
MIGEQTFDAAGQRWTLFLGNAAQCDVEEHYGKGFFGVVADAIPDIDPETAFAIGTAMSTGNLDGLSLAAIAKMQAAMKTVRLSVLRDLAWFGLRRHHPDVTLDDVSDIADDLGHEAFGDIIGKAIRAAQGKGDGDDDAALGKSPTRASGRTGKRSSASGRAPASKRRPSGTRARPATEPRSADA